MPQRDILTGSSNMSVVSPQELRLKLDSADEVSALLLRPSAARACFVFAHGAGAGMTHRFMEMVAAGLARAAQYPWSRTVQTTDQAIELLLARE